jgi:hypothetical protein
MKRNPGKSSFHNPSFWQYLKGMFFSSFNNARPDSFCKNIMRFFYQTISLPLVGINNIFNNLPLAFGQIGWIRFHDCLFFRALQTEENYLPVFEGLFNYYSHPIVNQYNDNLNLDF